VRAWGIANYTFARVKNAYSCSIRNRTSRLNSCCGVQVGQAVSPASPACGRFFHSFVSKRSFGIDVERSDG
jgi:hypothetical protein